MNTAEIGDQTHNLSSQCQSIAILLLSIIIMDCQLLNGQILLWDDFSHLQEEPNTGIMLRGDLEVDIEVWPVYN